MSADNEGKRLIEKDKDKDKMEDVPSPSVEEVDQGSFCRVKVFASPFS